MNTIQRQTVTGASAAGVQGTTKISSYIASIAALGLARKVIGGTIWEGRNPDQQQWHEIFEQVSGQLGCLSPDELKSTWGKTADVINTFMEQNGFPEVKLNPWPDDGASLGVGAVLKLAMEWMAPGQSTLIGCPAGDFPAAHLTEGIAFWNTKAHPEPVVQIKTTGKDVMLLSVLDEPLTGFDLFNRGRQLANAVLSGQASHARFDEVVFPKVKYDDFADVNWLIGLRTFDPAGRPWSLAQAIQKDRFEMDQKGAEFQSAFAGRMTLECCVQTRILEINRPFLAVLVRDGLQVPVMAGHIFPDAWKDPK